MDRAKYDEWVRLGFDKVAAAVAAGAETSMSNGYVDADGVTRYTLYVEVPK